MKIHRQYSAVKPSNEFTTNGQHGQKQWTHEQSFLLINNKSALAKLFARKTQFSG